MLEIIIFLCNILHIFFLYKKLVPYFFLWWKYPYFQYACVDQEWEHDITPHANNGHAFSPHIFPGTNVGHADGGITRTRAKRKLMNTQKARGCSWGHLGQDHMMKRSKGGDALFVFSPSATSSLFISPTSRFPVLYIYLLPHSFTEPEQLSDEADYLPKL